MIKLGNLRSQFFTELRKSRALVKKIYTGKRALTDLPNALQHFIIQSGFTTVGDIYQVKIDWQNTALRFSPRSRWRPIDCLQYNFLPDPIRLVYMKSKIMGLFGLEALDSFRHGRGHMAIKALQLFQLTNANGSEMDRAELATILAETIIIPDYALQTYTQWEEIDLYTIRGTINYHGVKASGIFYFNANFEIVKFETNDRYFTDSKGKFHQTKWTADCAGYQQHGKIRFPSSFIATWNFAESDFSYFKGEIKTITINS